MLLGFVLFSAKKEYMTEETIPGNEIIGRWMGLGNRVSWPKFHSDWNELIPALRKADKVLLGIENNDAVMAIDYALDSYAEFDIIKTWSGLVAFIKAIQPE
jgi:hypothetical protein